MIMYIRYTLYMIFDGVSIYNMMCDAACCCVMVRGAAWCCVAAWCVIDIYI